MCTFACKSIRIHLYTSNSCRKATQQLRCLFSSVCLSPTFPSRIHRCLRLTTGTGCKIRAVCAAGVFDAIMQVIGAVLVVVTSKFDPFVYRCGCIAFQMVFVVVVFHGTGRGRWVLAIWVSWPRCSKRWESSDNKLVGCLSLLTSRCWFAVVASSYGFSVSLAVSLVTLTRGASILTKSTIFNVQ